MSERISVDIVLPSFSVGGAERVTLALARSLDPDEFDVRLIALSGSGDFRVQAEQITEVVDLNRKRLRSALLPLAAVIRKKRPALVFASQVHLNIALLLLAPFLGSSRVVFREANMPSLCLQSGHWPKPFGWAYKWLARRASFVFATSRKMADEFSADFSIPADRLGILSNPVNVGDIRKNAGKAVRHPGKGRRFVAAGRLVRQKGFDRLISWMELMPPEDHLVILGDGPDRVSLERQIADAGLADRITLKGQTDNPWKFFAGSDAVLLSSRWEGMPNVALEALACGTPVIATPESGGIDDIRAAAPENAVSIASPGDDFVSAMKTVQPEPHETPRPSLLPEGHVLETVAQTFNSRLKALAS